MNSQGFGMLVLPVAQRTSSDRRQAVMTATVNRRKQPIAIIVAVVHLAFIRNVL